MTMRFKNNLPDSAAAGCCCVLLKHIFRNATKVTQLPTGLLFNSHLPAIINADTHRQMANIS